MTAAVLPNAKVSISNPFHVSSHPRPTGNASYARSPQPSDPASPSFISPPTPEPSTKAFHRIRSSLEQSLRSATRSKKQPPLPAPKDEFTTITLKNAKGKEKAVEPRKKDKERPTMLKRLESKVTFRRAGRESITPSPVPLSSSPETDHDPIDRMRAAGFSFQAPSLRQGSMSSPSLHLSSQALPSPKSRPSIPISSSSHADVVSTPTRERTRRSSLQPSRPEISGPIPLGSKPNVHGKPGVSHVMQHRPTKSVQLAVPSTPSSAAVDTYGEQLSSSESPTPTRATFIPSPPASPSPKSKRQLGRSSSRAAVSSGHLPLGSPPSPLTPRASSPIRARSPTTRPRVVTPPVAHPPVKSSSPSPGSRRPSVELPRRTSVERQRQPSVESPRRVSIDNPRSSLDSSTRLGSDSSSPRPRPTSPNQRSYMHNRHFNVSSASLSGPPNPEYRELIRRATSMLCKEVVRIPPHMARTEVGIRDWEEVELRMRALSRLERIWGKSGGAVGGSTSNLNASGSGGLSASGEERERRLFCDALRDGFVLCQLMNKLRSASIVRPDPREDGFARTSNVTKFLAACSSYGLPDEDLFQRDDLLEATGESLARVAKTIIALIQFVEFPVVERSKFLPGRGKKPPDLTIQTPYTPGGTVSRAAASTPNLLSTSPIPPSPTRNRANAPSALSSMRPGRPEVIREVNSKSSQETQQPKASEMPSIPRVQTPTPPPRSPLRARSTKRAEDNGLSAWVQTSISPPRSSVADSTHVSVGGDSLAEAILERQAVRRSVASSAMTETTVTTDVSSVFDMGRSNSSGGGHNKFGTIRTVTTDITSESPSITRTEGSAIADELARKRSLEGIGLKHARDRKVSESPMIDLSRVEEADENVATLKGEGREKQRPETAAQPVPINKPEKASAVHLRKGKWPDDFMDVFQAPSPTRVLTPKSQAFDVEDSSPHRASPISVSPPRKVAIVGGTRRNEGVEPLPQFPRRPTHRARHSIDTPGLLPRDPGHTRDSSPDGVAGPSGRIMLRRHSTKPGITQRNAVYVPRSDADESRGSDADSLVPFPRTVSGEHGSSAPSTPRTTTANESDTQGGNERPRVLRGRFQSDIDSSAARRRARPVSYDELGGKPTRSRFESMVNLGAQSNNASASDLLSRDAGGESRVRKTLILKEEGKPPIHFQLGNCIGRGQFGSVYRALNLTTGQMVAVKRIRLEGLKEDEVTTLMREVELVKSLSHPSIVKYEGMTRDEDMLNIVLEYAENGSLGQTLKAFGKLNERLVASYVVKILEGLHYLHQSQVVHCDLKAANILTTKNGNVKLSDFGVSLNLRAMEFDLKDVAGTPNWMAPEVIKLNGASTKSDIWSLGCTVIELLTGRPPYGDIPNTMTVMFRIVEDDMPALPERCSDLLRDFLTQCFNKDPERRPSAEQLCEHSWLKKNSGIYGELRPQDSIPFLRRVSADLQKSEALKYLAQIEMPETPTTDTRPDEFSNGLPRRRTSSSSILPLADNGLSLREHSFVKTTFSKPVICRVCRQGVKKSAVLCDQCSLIAHSRCAADAPPTCDLRAQLLLYAQYADKGNPASLYSNPIEAKRDLLPTSPASDVSYVVHTPRTSIDAPSATPTPTSVHPPTSYQFMKIFKRSLSNLSAESTPPAVPPKTREKEEKMLRKKAPVVLKKAAHDRPQSMTSNSTRSAVTATESLSSRHDRRSMMSNTTDKETHKSGNAPSAAENPGVNRSSKVTSASGATEAGSAHDDVDNEIPGALAADSRKHRRRDTKGSGNCTVQ